MIKKLNHLTFRKFNIFKLLSFFFLIHYNIGIIKNGMTEVYMQILRGDSLKDAVWKDNYLEPEDLMDQEIRQEYLNCMSELISSES